MKKNVHRTTNVRLQCFLKILMISKCILILVFVCSLQAFSKGYGQNRINISLKNVTLKKALKEIERNTDYRFVYNDDLVNAIPSTSVDISNGSLNDAMDKLLSNTQLVYRVSDNNLVIISAKGKEAQDISVTGTVTDSKGEGLPGVTIKIKGTGNGTATDINGKFKLNIPSSGNVILVVNYIGFKAQEIAVGNKTQLTIVLKEGDAKLLNEVNIVNIGYGTVSKEAVTGSVASISAKDIKDFPVSTAAEALAGKLAGVTVTTTEGKPGADILIRVRGGGSLTQDNTPLYIVDGVQVENALSLISPQEIQSIDVLKDIASTAIYGARGANGVVLITTKSGHDSRTIVSFSSYAGVRKITNELPVLNPYDFVQYQYQITNYNTTQLQKDAFTKNYGTYDDLDIYKNIPFTDWQGEVFGHNAESFTQNLNLTGGSKTASYSFTLNNTKEDGIQLQSGIKRTFASFRFDNNVSDKFKFGFNVRYSRQETDGPGTSNSGSQGNNRLRNAVRYRPYEGGGGTASIDVFDINYANLTNLTNPVILANNELSYVYKNDIITSVNASYNLTKSLSVRSIIGFTNTDNKLNMFSGVVTGLARQNSNQPITNIATGNTVNIINTNTINYNKTIGKFNTLSVVLGEETNQSDGKTFSAQTKYLPVDITPDQAFAGIQKATPPAGLVQDAPTTTQVANRLLSFFGRAQYAYKSKYLATFSYRADASSLFAEGHQWGFFPSGQLAWRIIEEPFIKKANLQWLDNLKLRLSYGSGGNNRIDPNLFKQTFYAGSTNYGYAIGDAITPGFASQTLANPIITWETTYSKNLGLDFEVFHNRLSGSVDIYQNNVKNLLLNALIPPTSGYKSQIQNIGETQNRGVELQLSGVIVNNKNFTYTTNFNIAFNRNKIVSLGSDLSGAPISSYTTASGWVNALNDFQVTVGQPVGQFFGYVSDGRYEIADFDAVLNSNGSYSYTLKAGIPNDGSALLGNKAPQPGDPKLKKLSNTTDMTIGVNDQTVLGNAQPLFTGGFNQAFGYKNFDLNIFMNFSYGGKEYNANKIEYTTNYNGYLDNNMLSVVADRWKMYNSAGVRVTDPTQLAAMNANTTFWTPPVGQYALTSYAIEDNSFLRISNITLGYSLPQSFLKRTGVFSKFRVYATVNNLYTFTKYTGYDPEASTRRSNPLTPNVDYAAYPRSRYILAGVDVSF
jgi:TonB-linked SusC/RagA family outer membrane protein